MKQAPKAPALLRSSPYSGIRRHGLEDLAQPTTLIHDLTDVVGSARLRVKLHAGQVLDTFGVGAISNMPVAKEYFVTGSAIVLGQKKRQIAVLLGDERDVLATPVLLQIIKVDERHRCECIYNIYLQIVAEEDRCVTAGRRPTAECLLDMR